MKINMKDYEDWKERARSERAEISKTDLIKICCRIASVAAEPKNKAVGMLEASIETVKIIDEFFPEKKKTEEKEDKAAEEPQEEKDAKYDDLKNRIFNHAASYKYPIAATVESLHTTEIRRDAKHAALISLILNAGLAEEYHDWLRINGYE